jgi:probable nitrogen fixation protein
MLQTVPRPGSGFLCDLARRLRARSDLEAWDGRSDREVVAALVRPHGRRDRDVAEVDPDVFLHIELFYETVAASVQARTGIPCVPMLRMHRDGHGHVVVLAGRLVVVSRRLRDAGRFGFESVEKLEEAGERLVEAGVELIARFPQVARHAP